MQTNFEINETIKLNNLNSFIFHFPNNFKLSEAENFEFKFATNDNLAVLFDTSALHSPEKFDRFLLMLLNGELILIINFRNKNEYVNFYVL